MTVPLVSRFLAAALLSGFACGVAWWLPGTATCAALAWLSAVLRVWVVRASPRPYRHVYAAGLVENTLGFYWICHAISVFGGFGHLGTAALFVLFVTISSLQHIIFVFAYRWLPQRLDAWLLRAAIAWTCSELASIRIFPWHWGHTQLAFTPFAQIADLAGSLLVTFVLFWMAEWLVALLVTREKRRAALAAPAVFVCCLLYGAARTAQFSDLPGEEIGVALVQGNISLEDKLDQAGFRRNRERYLQMSREAAAPGTLVIWPETVIMSFIGANVTSVADDGRLPYLGPGIPILFGALTFSSRDRVHNSALGVTEGGRVLPPYHKLILMPFGEYTPFGSYFPWLKELNATAGDFVPGDGVRVFELDAGGRKIEASPLICYEDVAPRLARAATQEGAKLLVNLTNDAWFGESVAPYQHHLIASFRAIENRRYLLRSTNSGLTAVVDPLGKTVSQLPIFTAGVLQEKVKQISYQTVYTAYLGQDPWWTLLALSIVMIIFEKARRPKLVIKSAAT